MWVSNQERSVIYENKVVVSSHGGHGVWPERNCRSHKVCAEINGFNRLCGWSVNTGQPWEAGRPDRDDRVATGHGLNQTGHSLFGAKRTIYSESHV